MSGKKTAENLNIFVEELALSLVGWQVEEAQARLITEPTYGDDYEQQIAVSATFRFLSEDWTDRFSDSSYAQEAFLTLNQRRNPAPTSNYRWVVLEKIKKAKKGLIRVSAKTDPWTCSKPLSPEDLDLRLTAYDLDDVSDLYINSKLSLPEPTSSVEVTVVDETTVPAIRTKVVAASAYLSKGEYKSTITMHAEGIFEFGGPEDLLKCYLGESEWDDEDATVVGTAPFEVDVPEIKFEILDESGFLLEDRTCTFSGHIPVDEHGNVPRRQPRWIGRDVIDLDDLPGEPSRVVVRVIDGD